MTNTDATVQLHENDAGAALFRINLIKWWVQSDPINSRAVHLKAKRRLCAMLGAQHDDGPYITEVVLNTLSIVNMWCLWNGRQDGNAQDMVNWSGYRKRWMDRYNWGISKCIEQGFMIKKKSHGGTKVGLTEHGLRLIKMYTQCFDIVIGEIAASRGKLIDQIAKRRYSFVQKKTLKEQCIASLETF